MSVIFNSISQFVEQVGRRTTQRFGTVLNYIFVYTGPQSGYNNFAKQLGSSPDGFPLLYLNNIETRDLAGGVLEVTLYYIGTDQGKTKYTNLKINLDLQTKSFSWSGNVQSSTIIDPATGNLAVLPYSIEWQYKTVEVAFSYTAFQSPVPLFESTAGQYAEISITYMVQTVGAPIQNALAPQIAVNFNARMLQIRFSAEQMTPTPLWNVNEVWALGYDMGNLGFFNIPTPG
jgi:hypothetical protein